MNRLKKPRHPCANCHTVRRNIRARTLCSKCYPLVLLLEKIEKWNFEGLAQIPDRLYPHGAPFDQQNYFEAIKKRYLRQLDDRLSFLRHREESYGKGVDGINIEYLLRRIGGRISPRYYKDRHYGHAGRIDWKFPPEQKQELYRLLLEIEETIPWRGLSWVRAINHLFDSTRSLRPPKLPPGYTDQKGS